MVGLLRFGPVDPVDIGHREDSVRGQLRDCLGYPDERVPGEQPVERGDILRLLLVVQFLLDLSRDISCRRRKIDRVSTVQQRKGDSQECGDQFGIGEIILNRLCHTGVLDLDDDVTAVMKPRSVHLADRGRGDRLLVELGIRLVDGQAELGL
ncbi:Uncharacterised protein [Mycobacteroides abscessus subsp. abscessus]|nr:Uncharacterised protein [Mycobacteroides abscessus subsp. abscessus]